MRGRTTTGRWQKLLAFVLCVAMLVGVLPFSLMTTAESEPDKIFVGFENWSLSGEGTWELGTGQGDAGYAAQVMTNGGAARLDADLLRVTGGKTYRIGAFVALPEDGAATLLVSAYADSTGNTAVGDAAAVAVLDAGDGYTELAGDYAVPADASYIRVSVELADATDTYLVDNAYVRAYTKASAIANSAQEAGNGWFEWHDGNPYTENGYAEVQEEGYDGSIGSVYMHTQNVSNDVYLCIYPQGIQPDQTYTLSMQMIGQFGYLNETTGLTWDTSGGHNGPIIRSNVGGFDNTSLSWQEIVTEGVTFKDESRPLFITLSKYTGTTHIVLDKIQLLDADGNDLLNGVGDFVGENGELSVSATNALPNGDFEDVLYTYLSLDEFNGTFEGAVSGSVDGWHLSDNATGDTLSVGAEGANKYLTFTKGETAVAGDGWVSLASPLLNVVGDAVYTVSADVRGEGYYILTGYYFNSVGVVGSFSKAEGTLTADWQTVSAELEIPADAEQLQLRLVYQGAAGAKMDTDNVSVNRVAPVVEQPDAPGSTETLAVIGKETEGAYNETNVWYQLDGNADYCFTDMSYGEIVAEGAADTGSLHMVNQTRTNGGDMQDVLIRIKPDGVKANTSYTLRVTYKGNLYRDAHNGLRWLESGDWSNLGWITGLGGAGDAVAASDWTTCDTAVSFNNDNASLDLQMTAWTHSNADMYLDNIQLLDANGNDLLNGAGNFVTITTSGDTDEPTVTETLAVIGKETEGAYNETNVWYQLDGNADYCFTDMSYGEIVAEGAADAGSLHMVNQTRTNGGDMQDVLIRIKPDGVKANTSYTLRVTYKGNLYRDAHNGLRWLESGDWSNLGWITGLGGAGDAVAASDWTTCDTAVSFNNDNASLDLQMTAWTHSNADMYLDNIQLLDANGNDLLNGAGNFVTVTTSGGSSEPTVTETLAVIGKETEGAYNETNVWYQLDGNADYCFTDMSYGEIVEEGAADAGSLHMVNKTRTGGEDMQDVLIRIKPDGVKANTNYTLRVTYKGNLYRDAHNGLRWLDANDWSNLGWITGLGGAGDAVAASDWTTCDTTVSFKSDNAYLDLQMTAWTHSNADMYLDNVKLLDADGNDLLNGAGNFVTVTTSGGTDDAVDTGTLMEIVPGATAGAGQWFEWDALPYADTHYAEIVEEGNADKGALHLHAQDAAGDVYVGIYPTGLVAEQTYTLTMTLKGTFGYLDATTGLSWDTGSARSGALIRSDSGLFTNTGAGWTATDWQTVSANISFSGDSNPLYIALSKYTWGGTGIYIDNLKLLDANGNDLLNGAGNFVTFASDDTASGTAVSLISFDFNTATEIPVQQWASITGHEQYEYSDVNYAEVVADGCADAGALRMVIGDSSKNDVYVAIMPEGVTAGQSYTLTMQVKGSFGYLDATTGMVWDTMLGNGAIINGTTGNYQNGNDWQTVTADITFATDQLPILLMVSKYTAGSTGTDVYFDNITLTDANGTDLLGGAGNFCVTGDGEEQPEEVIDTSNIVSGGDFQHLTVLTIPGWVLNGTITYDGIVRMETGATMQSLRYNVTGGDIFNLSYVGEGATVSVEFDNGVTKAIDGNAGLFAVPSDAVWMRVNVRAADATAKVTSVSLDKQSDSANLAFELCDPESGMPFNWVNYVAINDPSLSRDTYGSAYVYEWADGEGVDESGALKVTATMDLPNESGAVVDSVSHSIQLEVEPNKVYRLSYDAKLSGDQTVNVYPHLYILKEDGTPDLSTAWLTGANATGNDGEWATYKANFSTGASTKYVVVRLEVKALAAGSEVLFDNVALTEMGDASDPNFDFELGLDGEQPLNWEVYERDAATGAEGNFGAYEVVKADYASGDGSHAAMIKKLDERNMQLYMRSSLVKVKPNTSYLLEYDAMVQDAKANGILIFIRQYSDANRTAVPGDATFTWPTNTYAYGAFDWQVCGGIFTTDPACEYIQMSFVIVGTEMGTTFLDNLSFTEAEEIDDPNLDFEYSAAGKPVNWTGAVADGVFSATVTTDDYYRGKQSVLLTKRYAEINYGYIEMDKYIDVQAGDEIELVVHMRSRNAIGANFAACVYYVNAAGEEFSSSVSQERTLNTESEWSDWGEFRLVHTVPRNAVGCRFLLRVGGQQADVLIDSLDLYNYTETENVVFYENFAGPSADGMFGGWQIGETAGNVSFGTNGEASISGDASATGEIYTDLLTLQTDYVYTVTSSVRTTGTATGKLIVESLNWNDELIRRVVDLDITGTADLKATFESPSTTATRIYVQKTGGEGDVIVQNVQLQQTGEPSTSGGWEGAWIVHPDEVDNILGQPHPFADRYYYFRQEINLDSDVESAQIQMTADDRITLWINGEQAFDDTRTGDTWDLPTTMDIGEYLQKGKNVLSFRIYNGVYAYGLLYDGIIKMTNGSSLRFYSSEDVMVAQGSLGHSNDPDQTVVTNPDLDLSNWMMPDYVTEGNPVWSNAAIYAKVGGGAWGAIDFDNTEYSDYKLTSNEFTFPKNSLYAGDTITVTAQLMIEKELPTTNTFSVSFWKRNSIKEICDGTIALANGATTDDWPIGKEFTAEFELKIPDFLADGSYTVQFDKTVAIVSDYFINNKVGYVKVVQPTRELTTTSEIRMNNGKPTYYVNGVAKAPIWYARQERDSAFNAETVKKYAEYGLDTVVTYVLMRSTEGMYNPDGTIDTEAIDAMMLGTLSGNPDAQMQVAIDTTPPQWWLDANPDECVRMSDGTYSKEAFYSDKWKKDIGEFVVKVIDYMMEQPYANNITGIKITGGSTYEWQWWGITSAAAGLTGDYSTVGVQKYREWLKKTYGTNEAMQAAYNDSSVTFDNILPQTADVRSESEWHTILNVTDNRRLVDYEMFMSEAKTDAIIYFADLCKEAVNDRIVVGTYAGYITNGYNYEFSAGTANVLFERLLECDSLDYFKCPWNYGEREAGFTVEYMGPVDSVTAHGKLYVAEDDSRLNLHKLDMAQDSRASVGWTRTTRQSVEGIKRNFSYALSKGQTLDFYNLSSMSYYDDDQMYGIISEVLQEAELAVGLEHESAAEIAVFYDGESMLNIPGSEVENGMWATEVERFYKAALQYQRQDLAHIGAQYDRYILDDLVTGHVPDYKVYIMLTTLQIDEAERKAIEEQLMKDDKIIVWVYGAGVSDGETTDTQNMSDLIGMNIEVVDSEYKMVGAVNVIDDSHWLTAGMADRSYGGDAYYTMSPTFAVKDDSATALATHSTDGGFASGQVGLAVKDMGDWTSVYSAVPHLPVDLLRNILKQAGCHIYNENSTDVVLASNNYVAVHTLYGGERTITLPDNYLVYDVFNREIVAKDTDQFTFTSYDMETRLFRLSKPDTMQVYVGRTQGGKVTPEGITELPVGGDMTFTFEAEDGYRLNYLLVDGVKMTVSGSSYTFKNVMESHTVIANFSKIYDKPPIVEEEENDGGDNTPPADDNSPIVDVTDPADPEDEEPAEQEQPSEGTINQIITYYDDYYTYNWPAIIALGAGILVGIAAVILLLILLLKKNVIIMQDGRTVAKARAAKGTAKLDAAARKGALTGAKAIVRKGYVKKHNGETLTFTVNGAPVASAVMSGTDDQITDL